MIIAVLVLCVCFFCCCFSVELEMACVTNCWLFFFWGGGQSVPVEVFSFCVWCTTCLLRSVPHRKDLVFDVVVVIVCCVDSS